MKWQLDLHDDFLDELNEFAKPVRVEMLASMKVLTEFGPDLGRPRVDTLNGSKHANMKELRFKAEDRVWRVAFAFDPERTGILLAAGEKSGGSERRFYRQLISKADRRFDEHLDNLRRTKGHEVTSGSHRRASKGGEGGR